MNDPTNKQPEPQLPLHHILTPSHLQRSSYSLSVLDRISQEKADAEEDLAKAQPFVEEVIKRPLPILSPHPFIISLHLPTHSSYVSFSYVSLAYQYDHNVIPLLSHKYLGRAGGVIDQAQRSQRTQEARQAQ